MLDLAIYHDSIRHDCARIVKAVEQADPEASVAHCEDWPLDEVVVHLGQVHRWAAGLVRDGKPGEGEHPPPRDAAGLLNWFMGGAGEVIVALASADPEAECWTFERPPGQAWFWSRRQALETLIHRIDVESAVGPTTSIDLDLAVDGIEEVCDFWFDRQVDMERTPQLSGVVTLDPTDDDRQFSFGRDGSSSATISGSSEDLLLFLWNRPHGAITRSGDQALLSELADASVTS